jgi:hypothetical protein
MLHLLTYHIVERHVGYDWYERCLGNLDERIALYGDQNGEEEGQ